MLYLLPVIAISLALIDWLAVIKNWKRVEAFAKPGVILFLLAWAWAAAASPGRISFFLFGLAFSLLGDILLLPTIDRFIPGLLSFLLAHLAYLAGFNPNFPQLSLSAILIIAAGLLLSGVIFSRIAMQVRSKHPRLLIPVLVYAIALSGMAISALLTQVRVEWRTSAALLCSSGALLFYLSDTLLAWNRFVSPIRQGRATWMVAYHLGQFLLIAGVLLQYS